MQCVAQAWNVFLLRFSWPLEFFFLLHSSQTMHNTHSNWFCLLSLFVLSFFLNEVHANVFLCFACRLRNERKKFLYDRARNVCTFGFWCFLSLQKREEGETLLVCIWHDVWWMQNWLWSKLEREKEKGKKTSRIFNKVSFHFLFRYSLNANFWISHFSFSAKSIYQLLVDVKCNKFS